MKRWPMIAALLVPGVVLAGEFLPGGNTGALARGFALPVLGQPLLDGGRQQTGALLDITSEFVVEGTCPGECITLDGETTRLLLSHRRGLGAGWDVSVEVPLLSQGGGFLDSWIEEWHGWFGLPDGGRQAAPRDRYRYHYERNGEVLLDIDDTETYSGFGDITVGVGRRMGDNLALRGMVKLPTGDDAKLGGGNAGAALWLDAALPLPEGFEGFLAAGMSFNDRGAVLPDMQNREVVFGGIGVTTPFPFTDRVRILAQLYGHSRLYDGGQVTALARAGVPLTLGLQVRTGPASHFEFGFLEDLAVNASPDFTAYLALTYSPR